MRFAGLTNFRLERCSAAVALGALFVVEGAAAQSEPLSVVTVRYEAQAPCPARTVFIGNLLARTQRVRLTEDRSDAVVFAVQIVGAGPDSVGTLEVGTPGREPTLREVRAQTCEEVVAALALVAALTIDPDAETAPLTSDAVEAAAASLVEAPVAPAPAVGSPAGEPAQTAPQSDPPPQPAAAPPPLPPPVSPPVPERGSRGVEVGVGGQLEREEAPFGKPFLAWRGFVDISSPGDGLMRPSVGVSVGLGSAYVEQGPGGAELDWVAGRLDLCPVDLARVSWVAVRPCVAFDVGTVAGSGEDLDDDVVLEPHDARFTWASGALLGRADLEPVGPLLVRLEAGVVVPFTSDASFVFGEGTRTYTLLEVPPASLVAGAGLGLRF